MRTQQQILEKIENEKDDFFGVKRGDWIDFLEYKHAKKFLKEGVTEIDWKKCQKKNTEKAIKKEIIEYLPFAWGKANDCRGLSAGRSVDHMTAYLWLLNDEKLIDEFEEIEYEHYGKEKLVYVSDLVGFDWEAHDDGVRTNTG